MIDVYFRGNAINQFFEWQATDGKISRKLQELITECRRTPFTGRGKPEPLKYDRSGLWSRRITAEHRLIYRVKNGVLEIISCMGHYED